MEIKRKADLQTVAGPTDYFTGQATITGQFQRPEPSRVVLVAMGGEPITILMLRERLEEPRVAVGEACETGRRRAVFLGHGAALRASSWRDNGCE